MSAEGKKVLFVIAPENFRDEELFHPKEELEKAGAKTVIASLSRGEKTGMLGGKAVAELSVDEVNPKEFDAIVFVGGTGSSTYFQNPKAHELAKAFFSAGKPTAAICIAPSTLANAGLLNGKKATSYPSEKGNLEKRGAKFTAQGVTVDGKLITADGPKSAREFGRKIAQAL